jgi:hypothetical protein
MMKRGGSQVRAQPVDSHDTDEREGGNHEEDAAGFERYHANFRWRHDQWLPS